MFRFVHISDTHLHHDPHYLENSAKYPAQALATVLIETLRQLPFIPAFVLHTGDVVYQARSEAYSVMRDFAATLPCPVYYTAGNLDDASLMSSLLLNRETTATRLFYEVEINGVQLVCLDSNCYTNAKGQYLGRIDDAQLEWLEHICRRSDERLLIVALHHPALTVGVPWLDQTMSLINGDQFHRVLQSAQHRLRGVFHGHIHQPMEVVRDGILYCCTSSAPYSFEASPTMQPFDLDDNALPGYTVVNVTPQQTFTRRYNLPVPAGN